jgi:hypothetical protein
MNEWMNEWNDQIATYDQFRIIMATVTSDSDSLLLLNGCQATK